MAYHALYSARGNSIHFLSMQRSFGRLSQAGRRERLFRSGLRWLAFGGPTGRNADVTSGRSGGDAPCPSAICPFQDFKTEICTRRTAPRAATDAVAGGLFSAVQGTATPDTPPAFSVDAQIAQRP